MDDITASFQMQLKTVGGGSKESEDRAAKAEAEVLELRAQLKVAKEAAAAAEAVKEDAAALKMTKIQLQKAELDKTSLLNKVLPFVFALTLIEDSCIVVPTLFQLHTFSSCRTRSRRCVGSESFSLCIRDRLCVGVEG